MFKMLKKIITQKYGCSQDSYEIISEPSTWSSE